MCKLCCPPDNIKTKCMICGYSVIAPEDVDISELGFIYNSKCEHLYCQTHQENITDDIKTSNCVICRGLYIVRKSKTYV